MSSDEIVRVRALADEQITDALIIHIGLLRIAKAVHYAADDETWWARTCCALGVLRLRLRQRLIVN